MNFQCNPVLAPLKVLISNSMNRAARLLAMKILSGSVFGTNQLIDLILLVYDNEKQPATVIKFELESCAFACFNSVEVSTDIPSCRDADVFCFITNFDNPNIFENKGEIPDDQFDALYLTINIANNLYKSAPVETPIIELKTTKQRDKNPENKRRKQIFIADGLVALDILVSLSKDLPSDIFFCSTPLPAIAKSILGEYLKIPCNIINDVLVWGANDDEFYIDIEKPLVTTDKFSVESGCDWDRMGTDLLHNKIQLDHTQLNDSWLKKEFLARVQSSAKKNPNGSIYKANTLAKSLHDIYESRIINKKVNCSLGIISDGSLGTLKGFPYVLPIVFTGDSYAISKQFEEDTHLKLEIKRINKIVKNQHTKLISYCKKFSEENVINQALAVGNESSATSLIEGNTVTITE